MSDKKKKEWNVEDAAEKAGEDIGRGLKEIGDAAEKTGKDIEKGLKKGWEKGFGPRAKDTVTEGKDKDKKDD
jgi:hypothetical protein